MRRSASPGLEWTYARLLVVDDSVVDGRVGIALATTPGSTWTRATGLPARPGAQRRERPQGPHLLVQRHKEPEIVQQYVPRRRSRLGQEQRRLGVVLVAGSDAPRVGPRAQGGWRAVDRVVLWQRGQRPRRAGQLRGSVFMFSDAGTTSKLVGEEAALVRATTPAQVSAGGGCDTRGFSSKIIGRFFLTK
jgi:hypothetical protein